MTQRSRWTAVFYLLIASLLCGAEGKWMAEIPDAPPRWQSKLFHIPTWIIPIPDYDEDAFNATTLFSAITMGVSTLYALYHCFIVRRSSTSHGRRSMGQFNRLVMAYLVSTFFATLSFTFMNAGRIWASFGVFHNLFEISLLVDTVVRHTSIPNACFVPMCFAYLLTTMAIVVVAPWPLDALFFKFQGLATDFALAIGMTRLGLENLRAHRQANVATMYPDHDEPDDGSSTCDSNDDDNLILKDLEKKGQIMPPVHRHIFVLAAAASLHTFGNALVTFSNQFYCWVIFQFLYAVAFPMYAYYCVMEPTSSRIIWYKIDPVKELLVYVVSVSAAGLCIVVGVLNSEV